MMRLVTLLAVVDIDGGGAPRSREVGGGTSSTGDTRPETAALFLPKDNFHFEGFLVTGGLGITGTGGGGDKLRVALGGGESNAKGIGYMETGSNGSGARLVDALFLVLDLDLLVDEDLEALLISRANDCDASAKFANVSSLGLVVDGVTLPRPFRAPLFLRFVVDVDLDASRSRL
jgi:hypothetical protein